MSIENPTLAHFRHFIRRGGFSSLFTPSAPLHLSRTLYKSTLFMQNKPNLVRRRRIAKMNVNAFLQKDYENEPPSGPKKQTQFKPNSNPIKACPERSRMFRMGQF